MPRSTYLVAILALALATPATAQPTDHASAKLIGQLTSGVWVERRSKPARNGLYADAHIPDAGCRRAAVYRFAASGELSIVNDSCPSPLRLSARWSLTAQGHAQTTLDIDGAPVSLDMGARETVLVLRSNQPVQPALPTPVLMLDHK